MRAFVPEYRVSTHFWQPMMLVQHLARITGGTKGVTWHILHLNACESASLKAFGIVLLLTHMASWIFSISVFNLLAVPVFPALHGLAVVPNHLDSPEAGRWYSRQ